MVRHPGGSRLSAGVRTAVGLVLLALGACGLDPPLRVHERVMAVILARVAPVTHGTVLAPFTSPLDLWAALPGVWHAAAVASLVVALELGRLGRRLARRVCMVLMGLLTVAYPTTIVAADSRWWSNASGWLYDPWWLIKEVAALVLVAAGWHLVRGTQSMPRRPAKAPPAEQ